MITCSIWKLKKSQHHLIRYEVQPSDYIMDYDIIREINNADFKEWTEDFFSIGKCGNEYRFALTQEQFALILLEATDVHT